MNSLSQNLIKHLSYFTLDSTVPGSYTSPSRPQNTPTKPIPAPAVIQTAKPQSSDLDMSQFEKF